MAKANNFLKDFQKDHSELLKLISSFRNAIKTSKSNKAKEILGRIRRITDGHFSFEETYLYPRLRRLVCEITDNFGSQQQMVREFIEKSRNVLDNNKIVKNELSTLLDMLPRLTKFLMDCNDLTFLVDKFNGEDKDDLNRRFYEFRKTKNPVSV